MIKYLHREECTAAGQLFAARRSKRSFVLNVLNERNVSPRGSRSHREGIAGAFQETAGRHEQSSGVCHLK